jgi:hypothetical protein
MGPGPSQGPTQTTWFPIGRGMQAPRGAQSTAPNGRRAWPPLSFTRGSPRADTGADRPEYGCGPLGLIRLAGKIEASIHSVSAQRGTCGLISHRLRLFTVRRPGSRSDALPGLSASASPESRICAGVGAGSVLVWKATPGRRASHAGLSVVVGSGDRCSDGRYGSRMPSGPHATRGHARSGCMFGCMPVGRANSRSVA